jgi:hypothetical protein
MEISYTDKAILELLNNPKIIPPNDIIHKYTVASANDVELLVITVFLNIDVDYDNTKSRPFGQYGEKMLYDNNFDVRKLSETIVNKIIKPLGLLKSITWGVLIVIDSTGDRIIEYPMIKD